MPDIPIVVVAYNRSNSLKRILSSINNAHFPSKTTLYISIDGGDNEHVKQVAKDFDWKYGKKRILIHNNNIGLRKHVISCGDLALKHDGIIVLEDDLYVSPFFLNYVFGAFSFYEKEERIAGISLYAHAFNETAQLPFFPINDQNDVYFLQLASSWGQCWSKSQWKKFKSWYGSNSDKKSFHNGVPPSVMKWPESSWKKYYIKYMVENNLFFVYPRVSLSTNFGDSGTHHVGDNHYQVGLLYQKRSFRFVDFGESCAKYDGYCEILPETLNRYVNSFSGYSYTTDLYGNKPIEKITTDYILSSRSSSNPIYSYARKMIPHEANVIAGIAGDEISFSHISDINTNTQGYSNKRVVYYHKLPRWHLKEKKAKVDNPATLTENEEKLLRINSKQAGKLLFAPIIFMHKLYTIIRNILSNSS